MTIESSAFFEYEVATLDSRDPWDTGGVRPPNVTIPGPQTVIVHMFYGSMPIDLAVTVSYTLNANYPDHPVC